MILAPRVPCNSGRAGGQLKHVGGVQSAGREDSFGRDEYWESGRKVLTSVLLYVGLGSSLSSWQTARGFPRGGVLVGYVDPQRNLYTCDNQYLKFVGEDTFYGFLARQGSELFRDDDFSSLYTTNNGRTSVPPSILAKALLLQSHDRVSDEEAGLLKQLLAQDVERTTEGQAVLKDGVAKDRVPSVTDPEMRHGRKSASRKFTGHKGAIAVDTESGLITAADVLPGNASDNTDALALVEETRRNTGCEVAKVIGDCAYGDGATRRAFKEHGCELVVKVPRGGKPGYFAKGDFKIDLEHDCVTCPAGQTTRKWKLKKVRRGVRGECVAVKQFEFAAEQCRGCAHYRQCVSSKLGKGRSIVLHPEEGLLQEARAYQETAAFREDTKLRQTVEHRLARLVQLGIRQARYFGRAKTKWQLLLTAAVANLVLVAAWELATGTSPGPGTFSFSLLLQLTFFLLLVPNLIGVAKRRQPLVFTAPVRDCVPQTPGFRPDF
jgi:hypothetical protein